MKIYPEVKTSIGKSFKVDDFSLNLTPVFISVEVMITVLELQNITE